MPPSQGQDGGQLASSGERQRLSGIRPLGPEHPALCVWKPAVSRLLDVADTSEPLFPPLRGEDNPTSPAPRGWCRGNSREASWPPPSSLPPSTNSERQENSGNVRTIATASPSRASGERVPSLVGGVRARRPSWTGLGTFGRFVPCPPRAKPGLDHGDMTLNGTVPSDATRAEGGEGGQRQGGLGGGQRETGLRTGRAGSQRGNPETLVLSSENTSQLSVHKSNEETIRGGFNRT